jgi:hypothetical protein
MSYFIVYKGKIYYFPSKHRIFCFGGACFIIKLSRETKVITRGAKIIGRPKVYRGNELLANGKDRYWLRVRQNA